MLCLIYLFLLWFAVYHVYLLECLVFPSVLSVSSLLCSFPVFPDLFWKPRFLFWSLFKFPLLLLTPRVCLTCVSFLCPSMYLISCGHLCHIFVYSLYFCLIIRKLYFNLNQFWKLQICMQIFELYYKTKIYSTCIQRYTTSSSFSGRGNCLISSLCGRLLLFYLTCWSKWCPTGSALPAN